MNWWGFVKNKLKKQRDDGDIGLNHNNIIYGSDKLLELSSLLFRFMLKDPRL